MIQYAKIDGLDPSYRVCFLHEGRNTTVVIRHRREHSSWSRTVAKKGFLDAASAEVEAWIRQAVEEDDPQKAFEKRIEREFDFLFSHGELSRALPSLEMGVAI